MKEKWVCTEESENEPVNLEKVAVIHSNSEYHTITFFKTSDVAIECWEFESDERCREVYTKLYNLLNVEVL